MRNEKWKEFLKNSASEIDLAIETFFSDWNTEIAQISPRLLPLVKALGDTTKEGKRIRGALVLLGAELSGENTLEKSELLKIAVAYEIFQTAILAHDDIIDQSPIRRGKPSLHMLLGGDHYGTSQAICLGDIGFFLAYKLISASTFDDRLKSKATAFFSKSILETVMGEILDVEISYKKTGVIEADALAVARLKTAYYTFVAPLSLGAILGDADNKMLSAIGVYGENAGIAFQIEDDIVDIFGTEKITKKQIGGDIKEGKQTLLFIKAREKATKAQLEILGRYYGNETLDGKEIEEVKKVFIETGALKYAEGLVNYYSEKAETAISQITNDRERQQMLKDIVVTSSRAS